MNPQRWQQVKDLYQAALERGPDERDRFLSETCAADPGLREEIESLLAFHKEGDRIFETPIKQFAGRIFDEQTGTAGPAIDALIGRTLGEFTIRARIGEGGFGIVYKAEQLMLRREAVIKVLHARHRDSERMIERFMREAQLASRFE